MFLCYFTSAIKTVLFQKRQQLFVFYCPCPIAFSILKQVKHCYDLIKGLMPLLKSIVLQKKGAIRVYLSPRDNHRLKAIQRLKAPFPLAFTSVHRSVMMSWQVQSGCIEVGIKENVTKLGKSKWRDDFMGDTLSKKRCFDK